MNAHQHRPSRTLAISSSILLSYFMYALKPNSLARTAYLTSVFITPTTRALSPSLPVQAFRTANSCSTRPTRPNSIPATPATPTMTVSNPTSNAATDATVGEISGPTWTLEYPSLDSPALHADIAKADSHITAIESASEPLKPLVPHAQNITAVQASSVNFIPTICNIIIDYWQASIHLRNVHTQAMCVSSVDGTNPAAKKLSTLMQVRQSRLRQAFEPAALLLDLCPDDLFEGVLSHDASVKDAEYILRHSRRMGTHKLSLEEENVLTKFSITGHSAWGSLYSDLSSVIPVDVEQADGTSSTMGIASAEAMRDSPDERVRKASWEAIRKAWLPHQETCAAALNAITGWRLDLYEKRRYDSFLASSLHMNRMTRRTLDALLSAVDESSHVGRRGLQIQAKAFGKSALSPWDLYAPAPVGVDVGKVYSFDEGIELIASAVAEVDPEAGEFVYMMRDKKWIEASRGDTKRPGAYCTGFAKSKTPRVYLSDYNGRAALLLTLAHELGHAFHSWQMRDLPEAQSHYPMNLAETASIFFETVVGNKLLEKSESAEERFSILWGEAESAGAFLLNIPSRYRFEEELNERRADSTLSVQEIDDMMVRAWTKYYGDALLDLERVGVFSQSKLHFYLTGISFYNWPYTFGYLFALGVYAEYEHGSHGSFSQMYRELLRDTGRMHAEDVVEKHLGGRIDEAVFWKNAIAVAEAKIDQLEKASQDVGKA